MARASGRVLVVDDNKVIRQLIRVNLELEGFEVVTAVDGAECLEVVHDVRPDVVTLDMAMPRMNGLATAERLRADPRTRDLPVAIVSACTEYDFLGGGGPRIDAFLPKPFEPEHLVDLVKQLIEGRARGSGGERPVEGEGDGDGEGGDPAAPGAPGAASAQGQGGSPAQA
ncbi:response regulator [Streptomyces sp. NPDC003717]|uniref:response regulator n=1 Tax=Streptomyces sp. NPDC003717 TaxID=3154276 RepID=UPI0033B99245